MALVNAIGTQVPDPVVTAKTGIVVRVRPTYVPMRWLIAWKLLKGAGILVYLYCKYWWVTLPATGLIYVYVRWGWLGLVVVALVLAAIGNMWWWPPARPWLDRFLLWPLSGKLHRIQLNRRWADTMRGAGLAHHYDGHVVVPRLRRLVSRAYADTLTVRMLAGQIVDDYAHAALRLASSFQVRYITVSTAPRLDEVTLIFLRGDPLVHTVRPFPISALPEFTALPLGVGEHGLPWTLRLFGNQVLVIGASDAGKSSVGWSFIRSLAGGVATGLVNIWAFDPKGGMELAAGAAMYSRFLCDKYDDMADALDEAVTVLQQRTWRLRGVTRQHMPSVAEPLIVLVIDEIAALTSYCPDKTIRDRVKNAIALILSQGRAVGVHVFAMSQDPRKEAVPNRDLFTLRIGLRMTEAAHINLVLGDDAMERGAYCHRIPQTLPGVGYVIDVTQPGAERIRFSYLSDDDIRAMARVYARAGVVEGHLIPPVGSTPRPRPRPRRTTP